MAVMFLMLFCGEWLSVITAVVIVLTDFHSSLDCSAVIRVIEVGGGHAPPEHFEI